MEHFSPCSVVTMFICCARTWIP